MNKNYLTNLSKKDRGIALILSLFFLIMFFTLGTFLVFRTSLHKKITTSISENSLQVEQTEAAISSVRTNIALLNMNKGTFGTSLVFEGKMDEVTIQSIEDSDETTTAFSFYSKSSNSLNDEDANLTGDLTTTELFKFNFNGQKIEGLDTSLSNTPNPEWILNYADPSKKVGTTIMRYSYLVLDQTGKIDPNFANSAILKGASRREGFDTEIYREAQDVNSTQTAAIYDLSSLFYSAYNADNNTNNANNPAIAFAATRINNINELEGLINGSDGQAPVYPFNQSSFTQEASTGIYDGLLSSPIEKSAQNLALELLYPYSQTITYKEKEDIFNLAHITSDSFRTKTDSDKVDIVVNSIPYLKNMDSKAYLEYVPSAGQTEADIAAQLETLVQDPEKKIIPTSQPEFIAASLIDMVDHDLLATTNYGFYGASEPDKTRLSDGKTKAFSLAGKPWSYERWMQESNGKPYCGFEGLYIGQTTFQFRAYNMNEDFTGFENSVNIRDRDQIVVAPEVYCAYDLQNTALTDLLASAKDRNGTSLAGKNLLFYTRIRVTYNMAGLSGSGKDVDGKFIYDTDARQFDEIMELIAPLPNIKYIGNYDYKNDIGNSRNTKLFFANYAPGTPYDTMALKGKSNRTLGGNRPDAMQNWSCVMFSADDDHDPSNLIATSGLENTVAPITWYEELKHSDGTFYKPFINSVKITPESPVLIFLDIDGDSTPDEGEIVSISTPRFPDQGDDWVQDEKKGYSHHKNTNGSPTGDLYPLPETYRNYIIDNGAVAASVMTVATTGDPRLGYLPSSSQSLKIDANGNDLGGWMLDSYTTGTGTGAYNSNDLNKVHFTTDHFGKYHFDDPGVADIRLRYPAIEEVKLTFPKFDNEVIFPGTSNAWKKLAVQEGMTSFTYTVDSSENPTDASGAAVSDLDSFIRAAQDLSNYYPNRTIAPRNNVDKPGINSLSSFSLPLRDTDEDGTPDGFGDINLAADIGKINRGEPWRTLNIAQYNVSLLDDPTNKSLYSYSGVKGAYESDTDAVKTDGHNYNKTVQHPTLGNVKMIYPFNKLDLATDEEVDDLITDYSSDFNNSGKKGTLLNGGDAAIMDQIGFDEDNINSNTITLPAKTIYGSWNPNSAYPLALQSLISGVKVNRYELASQTYHKGDVENIKNPALPQWKVAALTSNFYKLINDNLDGSSNKAPFDRKYSYNTDIALSPGDGSYKEGFNVTSEFDNKSKTYMNGSQRLGTFRWGNVFANKKNYFLSDVEREMLYTNTKEFVSIRYNYYSTIILVENLQIIPDNAGSPGEKQIVSVESDVQAKVKSHYRVRAELAHDIITNEVKVLDYQILN